MDDSLGLRIFERISAGDTVRKVRIDLQRSGVVLTDQEILVQLAKRRRELGEARKRTGLLVRPV
jgi:hypothetical protein